MKTDFADKRWLHPEEEEKSFVIRLMDAALFIGAAGFGLLAVYVILSLQ